MEGEKMKVLRPIEMQKAMIDGLEAVEVLDAIIEEDLEKAKGDSAYINPDKTFKGGFEGCVRFQKEKKGLADENARKLCAYIGRRAGKIA